MPCELPVTFRKDLDEKIADLENSTVLIELYPPRDQVVVAAPSLAMETGEKSAISFTDMAPPYSVTDPKLIILKQLYDPFPRHHLSALQGSEIICGKARGILQAINLPVTHQFSIGVIKVCELCVLYLFNKRASQNEPDSPQVGIEILLPPGYWYNLSQQPFSRAYQPWTQNRI